MRKGMVMHLAIGSNRRGVDTVPDEQSILFSAIYR
jgi:hypothetical protein